MQPRVDAINKEFDTQAATTPAATKLPWEKTDPQHSASSAFIQYAEKRLYKNVPEAQPLSNPIPKGNKTKVRELFMSGDQMPIPIHASRRDAPLNSKLSRLLSILDRPMSVREMMAALGFGSRDKFLKNYLSPALKAGLIEMTQPDSPKSPTQKYRRAQGDK